MQTRKLVFPVSIFFLLTYRLWHRQTVLDNSPAPFCLSLKENLETVEKQYLVWVISIADVHCMNRIRINSESSSSCVINKYENHKISSFILNNCFWGTARIGITRREKSGMALFAETLFLHQYVIVPDFFHRNLAHVCS